MTSQYTTQFDTSDYLGIDASYDHDLRINTHSLKLVMESNRLRVKEA